MSIKDWAEREVELLCKKHSEDKSDYTGLCAKSALKALRSLEEDGHSGYSIGVTQNILNKLINHIPLVPIEESDDEWSRAKEFDSEEFVVYQAIRFNRLLKYVNKKSGEIKYNDSSVVNCVDENSEMIYYNKFVRNIAEEYICNNIKMPYLPSNAPYKVYTEDFASTGEYGVFDTKAILYMKTPKGDIINIYRYFKWIDSEVIEITQEEYNFRKDLCIKNRLGDDLYI